MIPLRYLLQQLSELGGDSVTDLGGGSLSANITSADTGLDNIAYGLLNNASIVKHAEGVLQHHSDGQNGSDGVDDALASDVGSRAYKIFESASEIFYRRARKLELKESS